MTYRNYMEDVVLEVLPDVLEKVKGGCKCEKCKEDIVAWCLNRLPPKYVVTKIGEAYTSISQLRAQAKTDVVSTLVQASRVVKAKPRHK